MTRCKNCDGKWTGKTLFKRHTTFERGMECPHCRTTQYISENYRRRMILPFLVIFIPPIAGVFFSPSLLLFLGLYAAIFAGVVFYMYFSLELSNEDEMQ